MNKPLVLDGTNYDYQNVCMVSFIKFVDNKAWKVMVNGWDPPMVVGPDGKATNIVMVEEDWDDKDEKSSKGNSKALNALFNKVDKNIFRLISNCAVAKEAWEILKTAHEGTSTMKMSRLQLLTTQFENLRMKEDESINEFHMNTIKIANTSGALGEKVLKAKLVRNILRSLPKRFDMKVTSIEEAQDINNLKVDELMGSL